MKLAAPLNTAPLFGELHTELLSLLRGLDVAQWALPTVAGSWRVRDVAAHLVDVQLRRLSLQRDGHAPPAPGVDLSRYEDLVAFLNELNQGWVQTMGRVSPQLLVDLLDVVGPQFAAFMTGLDPVGPAMFPVAWAGEEASENWFDVGRDYTELWHHQGQIRLAVGADLLESRRWLHPVLALALRGLRRSLKDVDRPAGTAVVVRLEGDAGGTWSAMASREGWALFQGSAPKAAAQVTMTDKVAWRLFFNALSAADTDEGVRGEGDPELVAGVLGLRSVMV